MSVITIRLDVLFFSRIEHVNEHDSSTWNLIIVASKLDVLSLVCVNYGYEHEDSNDVT